MKNLRYVAFVLTVLASAIGQKVDAAGRHSSGEVSFSALTRHIPAVSAVDEDDVVAAERALQKATNDYNDSILARMIATEMATLGNRMDAADAAGKTDDDAEKKFMDWQDAQKQAKNMALGEATENVTKAKRARMKQKMALRTIQERYSKALAARNEASKNYYQLLAMLSLGSVSKENYDTQLIPRLNKERLREAQRLAGARLIATQNNFEIGQERERLTGEASGCTEADVARAQHSLDIINGRLVELSR